MGYGALVVGHPIDLNRSQAECIKDELDEAIRKATRRKLWLAGGEFRQWMSPGRRWATAFVCKSVSFVGETYNGDSMNKIAPSALKQMRNHLSKGLPRIGAVEEMLKQRFPELAMEPQASLYMVLSDVNATTSTELMSGTDGWITWDDDDGWEVKIPSRPELAADFTGQLNQGPNGISKADYRKRQEALGLNIRDYSAYSSFVTGRKENIIDKEWFTIIDFYDEHATCWDIMLGGLVKEAMLYKDTHMTINPGLFERSGVGSWFHRTWTSG